MAGLPVLPAQNGNPVSMILPGENQLVGSHAAGNEAPVPDNRVVLIADSKGDIQSLVRRPAAAPKTGINSVVDGPMGGQILKLVVRSIFFSL